MESKIKINLTSATTLRLNVKGSSVTMNFPEAGDARILSQAKEILASSFSQYRAGERTLKTESRAAIAISNYGKDGLL